MLPDCASSPGTALVCDNEPAAVVDGDETENGLNVDLTSLSASSDEDL